MGERRECVVLENCGQKIFGIIHRPKGEKNCPAVLICHGLGGNKIGKQRLYVTLAQLLASNNIATLRIDFRGSGDSEGEFSDMTIDSEVSDALAAISFLQRDEQCAGKPLALFGRSFGGLIALQAAKQCGLVESLALWAPVFDGEQWRKLWAMVVEKKISKEQGDELMRVEGMKPGRKFFEQLFSLNVEGTLKAVNHLPMLHIHGEKDQIVNLSHAEQYIAAREKATAESKFVLMAESDHDFSQQNERSNALQLTLEWLMRTLNKR